MNVIRPESMPLYTRYILGPYSWLDDTSTVWTPDYYGLFPIKNRLDKDS